MNLTVELFFKDKLIVGADELHVDEFKIDEATGKLANSAVARVAAISAGVHALKMEKFLKGAIDESQSAADK